MTQAPGALPTPAVLDYERTLILAIELSNTSWVLAAQIPGLPGVKAKRPHVRPDTWMHPTTSSKRLKASCPTGAIRQKNGISFMSLQT